MTLAALQDQLHAAGADTVRVHRSWLVARRAVAELKPTGSCDMTAVLASGREIPVSRRYRDALEADPADDTWPAQS